MSPPIYPKQPGICFHCSHMFYNRLEDKKWDEYGMYLNENERMKVLLPTISFKGCVSFQGCTFAECNGGTYDPS